jgi:hypothetical protein
MDKQLRQKTPPRFIASLVAWLAPPALRDAVATETAQGYTTQPQYLLKAQRVISRAVAVNARKEFNVQRHVGSVLSVFIAYSAAPIGALTAILAVAIPVLIWRDGHLHDVELTPETAAGNGFAVGMAVLLSQAILFYTAHSLSTAWPGLLMGTGMCMVFVSGWQTVFNSKEPPPEPVLKPYRKAWRMTLLWLTGALSLLAADRQLLGSNSHLADFLMAVPFFPLFMISLALRAGTMGSLWFGPVIQTTLNTNMQKERFLKKLNRLFRTTFDGFWPQFFLRLFFIWIALPMVVVAVRVALGNTPVDSVNWTLLVSTACGFAVLCKTWIEVRKFNDRAAAELQKKVDASDKNA